MTVSCVFHALRREVECMTLFTECVAAGSVMYCAHCTVWYMERVKHRSTPLHWSSISVPGLNNRETGVLWNQSMQDTYSMYDKYHTTQYKAATIATAPTVHFDRAFSWVSRLQREVWDGLRKQRKQVKEAEQQVVEQKVVEQSKDTKEEVKKDEAVTDGAA